MLGDPKASPRRPKHQPLDPFKSTNNAEMSTHRNTCRSHISNTQTHTDITRDKTQTRDAQASRTTAKKAQGSQRKRSIASESKSKCLAAMRPPLLLALADGRIELLHRLRVLRETTDASDVSLRVMRPDIRQEGDAIHHELAIGRRHLSAVQSLEEVHLQVREVPTRKQIRRRRE